MQVSLELLNTVGSKSSVPDIVFASVGALANSLETDFLPYMDAFAPYLYKGLENQEEASLCSMAIGLVSDITRSLGDKVQPWCDDFMNRLLNDLQVSRVIAPNSAEELTNMQSQSLGNQFKPAILQCFGDIAQAIGGHFETYLPVVTQVLQQASTVTAGPDSPFELQDYVVSLREGIMDAWDGAIVAMTVGKKCTSTESSQLLCY
jgi:importin subunit beta-1